MSYTISKEDINAKPFMTRPPDFNRQRGMMKTDKVYECVITNIVELTSMEKLFHLKMTDQVEAEIFSFLPGPPRHPLSLSRP